MHADHALGVLQAAAILVIGMPEVFEARIASGRDLPLELGEQLLLELELLGRRLDHELTPASALASSDS